MAVIVLTSDDRAEQVLLLLHSAVTVPACGCHRAGPPRISTAQTFHLAVPRRAVRVLDELVTDRGRGGAPDHSDLGRPSHQQGWPVHRSIDEAASPRPRLCETRAASIGRLGLKSDRRTSAAAQLMSIILLQARGGQTGGQRKEAGDVVWQDD